MTTATLLPPTAMSLPRAAELPVVKMGFPRAAERRLLAAGITTALMLAEMASRHPTTLKHLTGVTPTKARRRCRRSHARWRRFFAKA